MIRLRWLTLPVAVLAAASLVFVACGGDDDDDADGGGTAATATAPSDGDREPTSAPEPEGDLVELGATAADFSFTLDADALPKNNEVNVTFNNGGAAPHTLTFFTDESFTAQLSSADSGRIAAGETGGFSFVTPAEGDALYYRCEIHPSQMQGEIGLE